MTAPDALLPADVMELLEQAELALTTAQRCNTERLDMEWIHTTGPYLIAALAAALRAAAAQSSAQRAALRELVEVNDLKTAWIMEPKNYTVETILNDPYITRWSQAWDAARAALEGES